MAMGNIPLKKMDMHVHTRFSTEGPDIGVVKVTVNMSGDPVELYQKAKKLGMDFVTFTDHNTIDGCLYFLEKMPHVDDFMVSEEITTYDPKYKFVIHVNAYNITKLQHKRIQQKREDFFKLIKYLKEQKIFFSYNHPYWNKYYDYFVMIPKPKERIYELAKNFPAIEVLNSFRMPKQNKLALEMAKKLNAIMIAGSDAHGGSIGRAYTLAKANNLKEFFKEVKQGRTQVKSKHYSYKAMYEECMNIFVENINKIREAHPSRKTKIITKLVSPIAKFFVKREIKKSNKTQKKIIKSMK